MKTILRLIVEKLTKLFDENSNPYVKFAVILILIALIFVAYYFGFSELRLMRLGV